VSAPDTAPTPSAAIRKPKPSAEAEDVTGQERHVHREVEHGDADAEEQPQHHADHRRPHRVAQALGDLLDHGGVPSRRRLGAGGQAQQGQRHHQQPDRVDEEGRDDADPGDEQAAHGRAHDPRRVEGRRVEGDGVDEVHPAHQLGQERLTGRGVEGLGEAGQHRHDADVPVPDASGGHERGERHRQRGEHELRRHQQAALGQAIGVGACDDREQQDGTELERADEAQAQRRVGQLQHEPRLGHGVHPAGDHRHQLGQEEAPEFGVVERAQTARKGHGLAVE